MYDNCSLNHFCGRISTGSWDLVPNPYEQKHQLINQRTCWKFIPHIKRKANKWSSHRATKNTYPDLIFGGISWRGKILLLLFFSWTFHWKHLSSLYRNYRKPIKGPKGKGDISSLPVFRSDFLKRRGISISFLHQKKMYFVLPNFTYIIELLFFMFYTKSCELHTWKETFLITLELL